MGRRMSMLAAVGVWLVIGRPTEGVPAALATLVATGVAGLAALTAAVVAGRTREYELLRGALRARGVARVAAAAGR